MEIILCAAIKINNELDAGGNPLILCGYRHHNIFWQKDERLQKNKSSEQGFLTSKNRFVDRVEALEIAHNVGQVDKNLTITKQELYSEDLYSIASGVNYKICKNDES